MIMWVLLIYYCGKHKRTIGPFVSEQLAAAYYGVYYTRKLEITYDTMRLDSPVSMLDTCCRKTNGA